jgi:hypothetical protein
MRAREFIIVEASTAAGWAVEPMMAPVRNAVKNTVVKGATNAVNAVKNASKITPYEKGVMGAADRAYDAKDLAQQGANIRSADKPYAGPVDFAADQAIQRGIGTGVTLAGDKALKTLAAKGIEKGAATWVPKALNIAGSAIKTGTGAVGTGVALASHSPELGPKDIPRAGPWKGMEINPKTNKPFTAADIEDYRTVYPDDWKPEYDAKGQEVKNRYDQDNPIRSRNKNKTGIDLPFGDSDVEVFNNPKYNPDKYDPKVTNDPLRAPNATLIKK